MRYISLILISFAFFSCNNNHPVGNEFTFNERNMYLADSVTFYLSKNTGDKKKSDKLFLQAIEVFRNKKDAKGSIPLFKSSILLQPQAKAYYELGNALMDVRGSGMHEAIEAYNMAEALDYKPLAKLLYNTACAYSILENEDSAFHYLISAIEFGYSNTQQIFRDKDLAFLREQTWSFTTKVDMALSGMSDPDKILWTLFAYEFKPVEFPLVLNADHVKKIEASDISYEFERFIPEMRDSRFSRDVGSEYYYAGKVKEGNGFKTLLYAVRDVMIDETIPPYYYLVSFDNTGKLIDKLMVAGRRNLDKPFREAVIQDNGDIEVRDFKIEYTGETPDHSKSIKTETGTVTYYVIKDDGKIVPKLTTLAMNR